MKQEKRFNFKLTFFRGANSVKLLRASQAEIDSEVLEINFLNSEALESASCNVFEGTKLEDSWLEDLQRSTRFSMHISFMISYLI